MDNISFNIENCCGCTACKTACPCGAISMVLDARGFYVPVVDEKACIRCGKCLAVCPTLQLPSERSPLNGYACWHSDAEKRRISSSGGVFIGLAEAILQQKGV
ncbi:MAG: 4Fe-4S binding protein, partial [Victivallales bacterium]|nr:4Fe-4S binding protein [Victivallales bacterium]